MKIDELIERVVQYEQRSILAKWERAAVAYRDETGLKTSEVGEEGAARARGIAEEIVEHRLLALLHGGNRAAPETVPKFTLSKDGYWDMDGYLRCKGVHFTG